MCFCLFDEMWQLKRRYRGNVFLSNKVFVLSCLVFCLLVDERLISISLRRAYVTLLHHPLLKHHREGSCLQAILFQIYYEYNVCRLIIF